MVALLAGISYSRIWFEFVGKEHRWMSFQSTSGRTLQHTSTCRFVVLAPWEMSFYSAHCSPCSLRTAHKCVIRWAFLRSSAVINFLLALMNLMREREKKTVSLPVFFVSCHTTMMKISSVIDLSSWFLTNGYCGTTMTKNMTLSYLSSRTIRQLIRDVRKRRIERCNCWERFLMLRARAAGKIDRIEAEMVKYCVECNGHCHLPF